MASLFPSAIWLSENKPQSASKPNILDAHLPSAGPLDWGSQCGAQIPSSLARTSAVVIRLLFLGRPLGGIGLDYTASVLLLPGSLLFLLYIFSCRSFLLVSWSLISSCFVNSCNFGVPVGGSELVFLLWYLGHPDLCSFLVMFKII